MPIVDIHTHIYPPGYVDLLRSRYSPDSSSNTVPYIRPLPNAPSSLRLVILPGEDDGSTTLGRPVGPEYWDIKEKIAFMDKHRIDCSVVSLANPWLDFLSPEEGIKMAREINSEVNAICGEHQKRLYAFGTLPLSAAAEDVVREVERLKDLPYMRGVIMGTSGLGKGLDDPELDPVYAALSRTQQLIFIHPHYGLPSSVYGPRSGDYGHVLPLALGFPMETTIAVTRMLVGGVWERHPDLKVLLAHSGGTLPFLAGRIESCIQHDSHLKKSGRLRDMANVWAILKKNVYLDAVVYGDVGLKAAVEASGSDRVMFGTDHPFFPPLEEDEAEWPSVKTNYKAIEKAFGGNEETAEAVLGGNAVKVLGLDV